MGVHIVIVLYYTARPKVEVEIRQVGSMQNHLFSHKGLSIYYVIQDRGEGSSRFITILHGERGGLPNLLQYYIGVASPIYYNFI